MRFVIFCKNNSFFLSVKIVLKPFFSLNVNLLQTKSIEHNSEILSKNEWHYMYITSKKRNQYSYYEMRKNIT